MNLKLKVKDIERVYVLVPFTPRNQYWCAREQDVWQISEVVRVTADAPGLIGYGETIAPHLNGCRVTDAAVERVRGKNPADFLGDDSLGYGLQMALYDLVGKALDVPAYRLFNLPRVREWCPISWWNVDMSPEDYAAEAREAVARGYTSHKMKARPWWDIYAQVEAVRGTVPEYFRIDLDWNQTLINASNAAPVLTRLDGYEIIALYESPIFQRDVDGLRQLRAKTTRPLALHFGDPPFPTAVRGEACDGFVIGGGVASVLAQGALAAAFDKPFFLQLVGTGITTALSLQLGAVLPMAQWPAVNCLNLYSDDLLVKPFEIRGGYARLPEDPGLGITVDEDALERFQIRSPFDYVRTPQLLRVEWAGGRERYFATFTQCLTDALNGNMPIHEHGAKLTPLPDDGTPEWADLYARAGQAPVFRHHHHF